MSLFCSHLLQEQGSWVTAEPGMALLPLPASLSALDGRTEGRQQIGSFRLNQKHWNLCFIFSTATQRDVPVLISGELVLLWGPDLYPTLLFFQIPLWPLKIPLSSPLELQITEKFICFPVSLSLRDMLMILKHLHISRAMRSTKRNISLIPSPPPKEKF